MRARRSLALTISSSFVLTIALVLLYSFISLKGKISDSFVKTETEKATQIVETALPMLSMYLFLGQEESVRTTLKALSINPNVKSVVLTTQTGQTLYTFQDPKHPHESDDIIVRRPISDQLTHQTINYLTVHYSSIHLRSLTKDLTALLEHIGMITLAATGILIMGLLYILSPFKYIARAIKRYKPGVSLNLPKSGHSKEAQTIITALHSMEETINRYDHDLQEVNHTLEAKVEQKTAELTRHLITDPLTKLPNRSALLQSLETQEPQCLILLDLDDFKVINDLYGMPSGDKLLIHMTTTLHDIAEIFHLSLYKLPGDEFALMSTHIIDTETLTSILDTIAQTFAKTPWLVRNQQIYSTATVGISHNTEDLLRTADMALKKAKDEKRCVVIYNASDFASYSLLLHNNLIVLDHIETAIKHDRVVPHFQPILSLSNGKIEKFEVLMRLRDSDGKLLFPGTFLDIAYKSKRYTELMVRMFQKSLPIIKSSSAYFSFNISVNDIHNHTFIETLFSMILDHGIGDRVIFEILESEEADDLSHVRSFIDQAKAMGCQIAVDDFGSGYSNFSRILALKIDYLKIDGSLVQALDGRDENARFIMETIVDFAQKAGIKTIAEFVSSSTIYHRTQILGVDFVQGFFIGRPSDELQTYFSEENKIIVL